jgi:hypothetical protein
MTGVAQLCECGCGRLAPVATRNRPERGQLVGEPVRFVRGHATRGKPASAETRLKMSAAHTGRRHTDASRARIAALAKRGPDHPEWKGDGVAYSTLHRWLSRIATKTGICSICGTERSTQWANLSGEYRRDLDDFAEMCVPCHSAFDNAKKEAA